MDHTASPLKEIPFRFTGTAGEYFGIWIVNVLLTVLTLGIYSAWAKVRRKRYFYGNTILNDAPFEYLANPVAILRGWLIALAVFIIYSLVSDLYPVSGPIFGILFLVALPWLVVRSLAFNARNSAYRNLRFHFERDYRQAFKVYVGIALLIPLTLGLILPYYIYRQKKFVVDNNGYGQTPFALAAGPGEFYKTYLKISGVVLLAVIGAVLVGGLFAGAMRAVFLHGHAAVRVPGAATAGLVPLLFIVLGYLMALAYVQTVLTNLVWNSTLIAGNRFRSSLRAWPMIGLYLSNAAAILLSLGLLAPWARIRMARYRLGNLALLAADDLSGFIAKEQQQVSATGEELGAIFGIDIGW